MALNASGRVDAKTRQRILKTARELGYRANLIGKTMRTGRSMTVGVLIRSNDTYFAQMLSGIQDCLQENGYAPITFSVRDEFNLLDQVHRMLEQRVDGIILKPESQLYEKSIKNIQRFKVPLVTVDNFISDSKNIDFAGVNDGQLGTMAAEYLLKLGHENLAIVTIDNDMHLNKRLEAFRKAVLEAGKKLRTINALNYKDFSWEKDFLQEPASGIFFMSDVMAAGFMRDAKSAGYSVPDEISVLGTGNYELSEYCSPRLTTFEQHSYNIGVNAVKLLLERMRGEIPLDSSQRHLLESATLIERESVSQMQR
jgi:LacI family transcriptional regulator